MYTELSQLQNKGFCSHQFNTIKAIAPSFFYNYRARSTEHIKSGVKYLNELLNEDFSRELLSDVLVYKTIDAKYDFLDSLLYASYFAAHKTLSVEASFFNSQTPKLAKLGMLMSLFTNLLDGILDEVPEIIDHEDLSFIGTQLIKQPWKASLIVTDPPKNSNRHPVVSLLLNVMVSVITYVINAPAWRQDHSIRAHFAKATRASFSSERRSTTHVMTTYWPSDLEFLKKVLEEKSVAPAWVGMLLPICFHGWPKGISPEHIREIATKLGILRGWFDDISDLADDLEKGVWSNVILEILKQNNSTHQKPEIAIRTINWSLTQPDLIESISKIGSDEFKGLMTYIDDLGLKDPSHLKQSIADKATFFYLKEVFLAN